MMRYVMKKPHEHGFMIIAVVIAMLVLATISLAFVTVVSREKDVLDITMKQHRAHKIANAGIERAIIELAHDGNWSDTPNPLYSSVSYDIGTYTVNTSNATQDTITLTSIGQAGSATQTITRNIAIDNDPNFPGFLIIDVSQTQVSGNHIQKIYLTNARLYDDIVLDKVILTISESISEQITSIQFKPDSGGGWQTKWSGLSPPGILLDITNLTINAGDTWQMRIFFDSPLSLDPATTGDLSIHLSDGSVYTMTGIPLGSL